MDFYLKYIFWYIQKEKLICSTGYKQSSSGSWTEGWHDVVTMDIQHLKLSPQGDVPGTIKLEDVLKRSGTGRTYLDFLDVLLTAQVYTNEAHSLFHSI